MKKRNITARWLMNSMGAVLAVLVVVMLVGSLAIQSYYYSSAKQFLTSKMNSISGNLSKSSRNNTATLSDRIKDVVESFEDKDKMELMAINRKGVVSITSSGFSPSVVTTMVDYEQAKQEANDTGYFTGRLASGEKVMAMTYIIPEANSDYEALRIVISLEQVDQQILQFIIAIILVCIAILALVFFSGMFFVRSIVIPVRKIGEIAGKYAKSDFSVRIEKKQDDEIGDLCDAINYMADELSAMDNMKNEFISSVSHELRTPLTAIKGWGETLVDIDDPETVRKGMRVINNETDRLAKMVEELLDFSRLQSGKFNLEMKNMDVLAELEDAVLMYTEKARRENIIIMYDGPEYLPIINGDRNRIRQVFINIIDNAIKYSNLDGGVVNIKALMDNGQIKVIISDSGVGISAEDLPNVKKKFFKANHSRHGSGIGLGVADEIVTMHGGTLELSSEKGVGTTVTITFPTIKKKKTEKN